MKSIKIVSALLAIALMTSVVTACADSSAGTGSSTGTPESSQAAGAGESSGEESEGSDSSAANITQVKDAKINYWINSGVEAETIIKIIDTEWNPNHPDFQITASIQPGSPDEYFQKLSTAFASGSGPDMFAMSPTDIVKYVNSGIAMDLEKWIRPNIDDYVPACVDGVTFNGKIYATPANMDLLALYYNKDMLEEAGVEPPTTWEETIEAAKKLSTDDHYGMSIDTNMSGYQNFEFYPFIWMNGGDVLADDQKTVLLNSDATLKAYGFYRDLINSGAVNKKLENNNGDITPFGTGRTAMQICGSWAISDLAMKYPEINYGITAYPVPEKGMKSSSDAGGWKYMVSSKGSDPEKCGDFLNWLFNDDPKYPAEMCMAASKFSPRKSVSEYAGDFYQKAPYDFFVNEILPIAGMEPPFTPEIIKAFGEGLQDAMYTEKALEDIVAETTAKCEEALK